MLNHISIGVRDLARTKRFYDAALAPLGYKCLDEGASSLGYGGDAVGTCGSVRRRARCRRTCNRGCISCFDAPTRTSVDAFHAGALGAGGKDNGGPGATNGLRAELLRGVRC